MSRICRVCEYEIGGDHESPGACIEVLRSRAEKAEDALARHGFRRCDIPACNCGSWHHVDGLAARWREIDDVIGEHNGKTLLAAVTDLIARVEKAEAEVERLRGVPSAATSSCADAIDGGRGSRTARATDCAPGGVR